LTRRIFECALVVALVALGAGVGAEGAAPATFRLDVDRWRLVESESGPVNYYAVVRDPQRPFIRGSYRPGYKKAVFGFELPDAEKERARKLSWSWRAIKLPQQGNECTPGKGDSAAVLYVTWRRFMRWYTLKYVWSSTGTPGTICDRRRNAFVAQDTIILRSGGPLGVWQDETLDLRAAFRTHFEGGNPKASVPPLLGLGLMTDGDQTRSESTGDYTDFVLSR
jgi:DUF3047 family protein